MSEALKEKIKLVLSKSLDLDLMYIIDEANLKALSFLSSFLADNKSSASSINVNIDGLAISEDNLNNRMKFKGRWLEVDMSFAIESDKRLNLIYKEKMGLDGFYCFQLDHVLLVFTIIGDFDVDIEDEEAEQLYHVKDVISLITQK